MLYRFDWHSLFSAPALPVVPLQCRPGFGSRCPDFTVQAKEQQRPHVAAGRHTGCIWQKGERSILSQSRLCCRGSELMVTGALKISRWLPPMVLFPFPWCTAVLSLMLWVPVRPNCRGNLCQLALKVETVAATASGRHWRALRVRD